MSDLIALEKSIKGTGGGNKNGEGKRKEGKSRRESRLEPTVVPKEKQPKKRILRVMAKRESKIFENPKKAIFMKGTNSSQTLNDICKELFLLKKPNCVSLTKKNNIHPFEDASSLEFFSNKNDASLLAFASHSKKRPNSLTFGRFFDHLLLDLIETSVDNFVSTFSLGGSNAIPEGNKPCFIFTGEEFEQNEEYKTFANLLLDFFRGEVVDQINLSGLNHVISCTSAPNNKVYFRVYKVLLKKSGSKVPRVELEEIGPNIDFTIKRTVLGAPEIMKEALRIPKDIKPSKIKNIEKTLEGTKGTIHMRKQELGELQTRKLKAFKRGREEKEDNNANKQPRKVGKNAPSASIQEE